MSQCTPLTDRQTDSFLLTRPPCIQFSAVKTTPVTFTRNMKRLVMLASTCFFQSTILLLNAKKIMHRMLSWKHLFLKIYLYTRVLSRTTEIQADTGRWSFQ